MTEGDEVCPVVEYSVPESDPVLVPFSSVPELTCTASVSYFDSINFLDFVHAQFHCPMSNTSEDESTSALRGFTEVPSLMELLSAKGYPVCGAINITREEDGLAIYRAEATQSNHIIYIVIIAGVVFVIALCLRTRKEDLDRARAKDKEDLDRARAKDKEDLDRARAKDLDDKVLAVVEKFVTQDKFTGAEAVEVLKTLITKDVRKIADVQEVEQA